MGTDLFGEDLFMIQNVNSGKVLDVPGGSSDPVQLQQFTPNGGDNQLWTIRHSPVVCGEDACSTERLALINKGSGMAIELPGGNAAPGNFIRQNFYHGDGINRLDSQTWIREQ
jgi:hypothetical protein